MLSESIVAVLEQAIDEGFVKKAEEYIQISSTKKVEVPPPPIRTIMTLTGQRYASITVSAPEEYRGQLAGVFVVPIMDNRQHRPGSKLWFIPLVDNHQGRAKGMVCISRVPILAQLYGAQKTWQPEQLEQPSMIRSLDESMIFLANVGAKNPEVVKGWKDYYQTYKDILPKGAAIAIREKLSAFRYIS